MKALPPELIAALIENDDKRTKAGSPDCDECGTKLKEGYCPNTACEMDAPIPTFPCEYCGHCEQPDKCVWSIACPKCGSEPTQLCKSTSGRIEGLHLERWSCLTG